MAQGWVVWTGWRGRFAEDGGSKIRSRRQKKTQLGDSEWRRWVGEWSYCSKAVVYHPSGGALREAR
jgi:hypothetical protein